MSCSKAGAAIVHLHTRELNGVKVIDKQSIDLVKRINPQNNCIDVNQYEIIIDELLKYDPSLILNLSTSIRNSSDNNTINGDKSRRQHLKYYGLRKIPPDIASLSLSDVFFEEGDGYCNNDSFIFEQISHFKHYEIRPEIEVFNKTILHHACDTYSGMLRDAGLPILFMLIIGVKQVKFDLQARTLVDDALIPSNIHARVVYLLASHNLASQEQAIEILIKHIAPFVRLIRNKYQHAKISILAVGIIQSIISALAVKLNLDGVRVGLEDTLNITDTTVAGNVRRAYSSSEQVALIKSQLESEGILVQTVENLRDELNMQRPEVKIFRKLGDLLKVKTTKLSELITRKINPQDLISWIQPIFSQYQVMERWLYEEIMQKISKEYFSLKEIASIIWQTCKAFRVSIRYFIEEIERYPYNNIPTKYFYVIHNLNYIIELIACFNKDTYSEQYEKLLSRYSLFKDHKKIPWIISEHQFKTQELRFLEYVSFIPCQYNYDRTSVTNVQLRSDKNYSAVMAILFNAMKHELLKLRSSSDAHIKQKGILWYTTEKKSNGNIHSYLIDSIHTYKRNNTLEWIVLPSTVTTNYPLGIKLAFKLAETLYKFIDEVNHTTSCKRIKLSILGAIHSGVEEDNETVIEATMLLNRFLYNMDHANKLGSYSCKLLYEQLLLPRIVAYQDELMYSSSGCVIRDDNNTPLYRNKNKAVKINASLIPNLPLLKILAHSSGITTAQQLDNLLLKDMITLGYSEQDKLAIFNKTLVLSFASASDIIIDAYGSSVIDITACNDIRSLAGTTTTDYLCSSTQALRQFEEQIRSSRSNGVDIRLDNAHYKVIVRRGIHGKKVLRVTKIFLGDDPTRLHDGHSIKRYLKDLPDTVKDWIRHIMHSDISSYADQLLDRLLMLKD